MCNHCLRRRLQRNCEDFDGHLRRMLLGQAAAQVKAKALTFESPVLEVTVYQRPVPKVWRYCLKQEATAKSSSLFLHYLFNHIIGLKVRDRVGSRISFWLLGRWRSVNCDRLFFLDSILNHTFADAPSYRSPGQIYLPHAVNKMHILIRYKKATAVE